MDGAGHGRDFPLRKLCSKPLHIKLAEIHKMAGHTNVSESPGDLTGWDQESERAPVIKGTHSFSPLPLDSHLISQNSNLQNECSVM